jgi:uncharacterized protein
MQQVIQKTETFVKTFHQHDTSGHDWWHIHRVRNLSLKIAATEQANLLVVELAALLHDIPDHKLNNEAVGMNSINEFLNAMNLPETTIQHVIDIIEKVSFKGTNVQTNMPSIEGKIVQDADRLDAIGAIGIARVFAYGGHRRQSMHNPNIEPKQHDSFEEYKSAETTSINHFHEKLLLLKDRMNTETGKAMAQDRHRFMQQYLNHFHDEWDGK